MPPANSECVSGTRLEKNRIFKLPQMVQCIAESGGVIYMPRPIVRIHRLSFRDPIPGYVGDERNFRLAQLNLSYLFSESRYDRVEHFRVKGMRIFYRPGKYIPFVQYPFKFSYCRYRTGYYT